MSSDNLNGITLTVAFGLDSKKCTEDEKVRPILADLTSDLQLSLSGLRTCVRQQYLLFEEVFSILDIPKFQGSNIAVVLPNSAEYVTTFLSIAYGGGINCLLNPKLTSEEISFAVNDMRCNLMILGSEGNPDAEKVADECNIPVLKILLAKDDTTGLVAPSFILADGRTISTKEINEESSLTSTVTGHQICLRLHTSGTTSKPKTVPITHSMIVCSLWNIIKTYGWKPERGDTGLLVMPLFHVHGLFCGCLAPLLKQTKVAVCSGRSFHKSLFWNDVETQKATWVTAVPSIWQILTQSPHPTIQRGFRFARGCSASMAPAVLNAVEKEFKTEVLEAYAMTEATHQMLSNVAGSRQIGLVGKPQGLDVVVVDSTTKQVKERGEIGEICVRGYNVIQAYEGLDESTNASHFLAQDQLSWPGAVGELAFLSRAFDLSKAPDSQYESIMHQYMNDDEQFPESSDWTSSPLKARKFLITGDTGYMTPEGYVGLVGRSKELINRGGEKISPLEVDAVFSEFEEVKEVSSFGGKDPILGEVVQVCIVLQDGLNGSQQIANKLREKCVGRLASFKIPAKMFFVGSLPKGPTGKVLRRLLIEHTQELSGW